MADSTIFTGSSRYSSDFQAVVDRSVAIASLPTRQLEAERVSLQAKSAALSGLGLKVDTLNTAVTSLQAAVKPSRSANSSNSSAVSAHAAEAARPGSWLVTVLDVGAPTTSLTRADLPTVSDPATGGLSSATELVLSVDGVSHTLTPRDTSLNALLDAIDAVPDSGVSASLINVGTTAAPSYRLSLQSTRLGSVPVSLSDGTELLSTVATGTAASYRIAGFPDAISSDSREVTLAPGVTATLEDEGEATVTVSKSSDGLRRALTTFVSAYNAALDEVDRQRGAKAGVLSGDSAVGTTSQVLRRLSGYSAPSGALTSLSELGIGFNDQGRLVTDEAVLTKALAENEAGVQEFLGDESRGFVQAALAEVDALADPETGVLPSGLRTYQVGITRQDRLLADSEERISRLRESLTARIAASDALIAALEQQVRYITGIFASYSGNDN